MHAKFSPPDSPIQFSPAAAHRRQMLWQVWVPLLASIVLVLALAALAIVGAVQGSPQVDHWGAISAVLVILPVLLGLLLVMAIVGGLAFGVTWLLKQTPKWMLKVQLFMLHLSLTIRRAADVATKPVVTVNTFTARVNTLWNRIFHRKPA